MVKFPKKVLKAFQELKDAYGRDAELKFLNGKFRIFEVTYKEDSQSNEPIRVTNYIGYITKDGFIVPARPKRKNLKFGNGEKLKINNNVEENKSPNKKLTLKNNDIKLLKALSMNSRLSLKGLSEITGISIHALEYRIERLERLLGIKYTLELNMNNLGFSEYMILAKFTRDKLNFEKIKEGISKNPMVQLALATKGIYDLVIFCVAENNNVVAEVLDNIRTSEALNDIEAEWYITPIAGSYGFIPLRQEFFDALKEKVWQRKKKGEKHNLSSLTYREYALLRELNENSRKSLSSIDKKYNLPAGSAKKAYNDLKNEEGKNVISRPTLMVKNINKKYDMALIAVLINYTEFMRFRDNHRKYIIDEPEYLINRFSYICDMEIPNAILYLFPILNEKDIGKIKSELSEIIKGVKFDSLIVEKAIVGDIDYRKFDNLYSMQYINLVKRKSISPKKRVSYGV
ncbi:Lrp-AsnC family transcriptional regulator [Candidatus Mancarchaeum acidiphilum]|uniref:Lrp-AsnC family transcriptional regulator n=1 Tax=Candidatus Mancarchaeum acidiphilum TaxID=1920749 RepID=A0A218NN58_9ARCH|nr:Lrp/AsnC family transcriptional regulator [Candidatus Mancarchaeum acidiphilum]ASI13884.1 Lrp-AsnC family transcriptional regulator [Candidatus Mancarchaeum acidiphilum]